MTGWIISGLSKHRRFLSIVALAAVASGSGLVNLFAVLGGRAVREPSLVVRTLLPLEFHGAPDWVSMLTGYALVISSLQILSRKRRALWLLSATALAAALYHLRADPLQAGSAALLLALMVACRGEFRVGSSRLDLATAGAQAAAGMVVALCYGIAGFWLLETREFGINFHWWQALLGVIRVLGFVPDDLIPRTPYARWFLDSLHLITGAALAYAFFVLYRPVRYRLSTAGRDRERAAAILDRHGRSAQDFFKLWDDKSLFFSRSGNCFLAYRVSRSYAIALGDPVGPEGELEATIREFCDFCRAHGWRCGFHQVHKDRLAIYERLGFRKLKIGDEALVDLAGYSLQGKSMKEFRNTVNKLDRVGVSVVRFEPPLADGLVDALQEVSDEWLRLPGRRERRFTLGRFERSYVRSTPVYVAFDAHGKAQAFLNLVPCYQPGLASPDLMRRRADAPNGVMDFLLAKAFLDLKVRGVRRFSLGMAPMSGFQEDEHATLVDRMVRLLLSRLDFLFSYEGLWRYKAKYASDWEPCYDAYRSVFDLPRLAVALKGVSEIPQRERRAA